MSRKQSIDTIIRIRLKHRPGQLARVAADIDEEGALLGEIATLSRGEEDTLRDITIETSADEQTLRVVARVHAVEGAEVIATRDPVFELHRGGKIHSGSRVSLEHLRDLRAIYTPGVARVVRVDLGGG